jgi:hypothetical protein
MSGDVSVRVRVRVDEDLVHPIGVVVTKVAHQLAPARARRVSDGAEQISRDR